MKMKLIDYKIPAECSRVSIEAIDNKLLIIFEPEHYGDFHCDLTDQRAYQRDNVYLLLVQSIYLADETGSQRKPRIHGRSPCIRDGA